MKLRLWLPDGPIIFERDGVWYFSNAVLGDECDSGFWDISARAAYPDPEQVIYELPLEVDE